MNWVLAGQTNMLGRRLATGLTSRPVAVVVPAFTPASLFAAGEQGVWYDPSDLTTMFEDSAGTTAVHTPGNGTADSPVGKILDKSGRGNHATQSTSTARPTLSAKYNIYQYTQVFTNAYWNKYAVTATDNDIVAPDSTTTGAKILEQVGTSEKYVGTTNTVGALTGAHKFSAALKYLGRQWISLGIWSGSQNRAWFDIQNGVVGTTETNVTSSIQNLGNGWYRCTMVLSANTSGTTFPSVAVQNGDGLGTAVVGDSTKGFYVWGADLRSNNDGVGLPAYQRVVDANTYDSTDFPYYLKSDGVDDGEVTSSIDFSGTNKITVFAGLRKLSDSALASVAELSATIASNNGSFLLSAPNSAAANYNFSSKGTTQVDNTVTTYTSPITSIVTGIGDISAPNNQIRVNASLVGTQTGSQGTGNYGNYALYLFRRGGSSAPFNGRTYGMIVRGASSTATEITNTETWLNGKTKAY